MNKIVIFLFTLLYTVHICANTNSIEKYWCCKGHFNVDQRNFVMTLAELVQPRYVLETGFCTGRSSASVLCSSSPTLFISVDIDLDYMRPEGRQYATFLQDSFLNYKVIEADSKKLLTPQFFMANYPEGIDWLTIDGDHSYRGCSVDLAVTRYLNKMGIVVIDDYKSGPPNGAYLPQVTKAVDDFCNHSKEFFKVVWNKKGKGCAVLTRSKELSEKINYLIKQGY